MLYIDFRVLKNKLVWDRWYNIGGDEDRTDHTRVFDEWYKNIRHWNSPPTKSDYEDLHELLWFADEAKKDEDYWSKRPLCAAVGVKGDYLERAKELVNNGCNVLFIDIAHGHHKLMENAINKLKGENNVEVVAGSVATAEGVRFLCENERIRLESEWEMEAYVKRELELVWVCLKLLLFLILSPLLMSIMFLLLLMVVFVLSVMCVKDLLVGLIRLCWAPFYLVQKKVQEILKK